MGKHVSLHEATLRTAIQMMTVRPGRQEAVCAAYFLWFIGGAQSQKRCLPLAVCADASDESLQVVSHGDKNRPHSIDTACVPAKYVWNEQTLVIKKTKRTQLVHKQMLNNLCKTQMHTVQGHPVQCGSSGGL